MKKKVLITGGLGFIGSHLARRCVEDGDEVTILSRSDKKINNIKDIAHKVTLCLKDIQNIGEEVKGKDEIYHLAGTVDNYALKEGEPYKDIAINCNGTIALLEACKNFNLEAKIVFGSTFFVNGNVNDLPATPQSPCNPLGLYGVTRLAAEQFCHVYHAVYGLKPVIARFTNVFGPFEQGDNKKKAGFNFMINQALNGEELSLYSNGEFFRDYIFVDDVVDACRVLAARGTPNNVYYVGRGKVKFKDLISLVAKAIPGTIIKSVEPPQFHNQVGIKDFYCDTTPLQELGWKPEVSLKEGIQRTVDYYRKAKT